MHEVRSAEESATVTGDEETRGGRIRERLDALGISDREWYRRTKVDRKTLGRAIDNDPVVRDATYDHIEMWLDRLEGLTNAEPRAGVLADDPTGDMVEFTIEGNFGVRAVVRGPVRDMEELKDAVARLVREMKGPDGNDDPAEK